MEPNEMTKQEDKKPLDRIEMPDWGEIQAELGCAKSIDDMVGRAGIFTRLFSKTLEAELSEYLG